KCLHVAEKHQAALPKPETPDHLEQPQRIVEEPSAIMNPRQAGNRQEPSGEHLLPEFLNFGALCEEAVPADVKPVTLVFLGARDAPNARVHLQDHRLPMMMDKFPRGGQSRGTPPNDGAFTSSHAFSLSPPRGVVPSRTTDHAYGRTRLRWPS